MISYSFRQFSGQGKDVILIRIVVRVLHRGCDDPGRGGGHESVRWRLSDARERGSKHFTFFASGITTPVADFRDGARRIVDAVTAALPRLSHLCELGKVVHVLWSGPLGFSSEPGHSHRDVHRKSDSWLLAIADDVYSGIDLRSKNPGNRFRTLMMQALLVNRFTSFL